MPDDLPCREGGALLTVVGPFGTVHQISPLTLALSLQGRGNPMKTRSPG